MFKKKTLIGIGTAVFFIFMGTAYAFQDVYPDEAYEMVLNDSDVYILDVRTSAEWTWVGHPGPNKLINKKTRLPEGAGLNGKVVNISYLITRNGEDIYNKQFLGDVRKMFYNKPGATLIIMCRSGHRSRAAAGLLEPEGFNVMNMATGFEGDNDDKGYRTVNGWVNAGLPYSYKGAGYLVPGN